MIFPTVSNQIILWFLLSMKEEHQHWSSNLSINTEVKKLTTLQQDKHTVKQMFCKCIVGHIFSYKQSLITIAAVTYQIGDPSMSQLPNTPSFILQHTIKQKTQTPLESLKRRGKIWAHLLNKKTFVKNAITNSFFITKLLPLFNSR